ncbi:hypothetical protein SCALM49S_10224 [Streptomyces californicus]
MVVNPLSGYSLGQCSNSVRPASADCNDHAPTGRPESGPLTCKNVKDWDAGAKGGMPKDAGVERFAGLAHA